MSHPKPQERFVADPREPIFVDRDTGLRWRVPPDDAPVPFDLAVDDPLSPEWRLPSVAELMDVLCAGGGALAAGGLEAGSLFWTGSQSPFAPETEVRVVVCEPGPTYGVGVLDKAQTAHSWLVRRRLGDPS